MQVTSSSAEETRALGKALARVAEPGMVVALDGDLGAGKTTLVSGFAEEMGAAEPVASPTFVLMRVYRGRLPLYHFDAYRLEETDSLEDLGLDDYFWGDGVSLVEWAERLGHVLPDDRLDVTLAQAGGAERRITITPRGPLHARMAARIAGVQEAS